MPMNGLVNWQRMAWSGCFSAETNTGDLVSNDTAGTPTSGSIRSPSRVCCKGLAGIENTGHGHLPIGCLFGRDVPKSGCFRNVVNDTRVQFRSVPTTLGATGMRYRNFCGISPRGIARSPPRCAARACDLQAQWAYLLPINNPLSPNRNNRIGGYRGFVNLRPSRKTIF